MIQANNIKSEMARKVIEEFDKSINKALSSRIKNKINFKVRLYIFVWPIFLKNSQFWETNFFFKKNNVMLLLHAIRQYFD